MCLILGYNVLRLELLKLVRFFCIKLVGEEYLCVFVVVVGMWVIYLNYNIRILIVGSRCY